MRRAAAAFFFIAYYNIHFRFMSADFFPFVSDVAVSRGWASNLLLYGDIQSSSSKEIPVRTFESRPTRIKRVYTRYLNVKPIQVTRHQPKTLLYVWPTANANQHKKKKINNKRINTGWRNVAQECRENVIKCSLSVFKRDTQCEHLKGRIAIGATLFVRAISGEDSDKRLLLPFLGPVNGSEII